MTHLAPLTALMLAFAATLTAPAAFAECDISETKCAVNGGKCNIHFRNRTSDAKGSDTGTILDQSSSAQTVVVRAIDGDKNKVGNKLQIPAGSKKTMNMDKKAAKKTGFDSIQISSKDFAFAVAGVRMACDDVKAVLNGNGTCKIIHGIEKGYTSTYRLGYQCDGGAVMGPTSTPY
ncbi:MAG: hypothetical protein AAFO74_13375 [Pseudomonadota bacterium]